MTALLYAAAGVCFSDCAAWMRPMYYTDEEFESTVAVRIDPNPFSPNVFYENDDKPQSVAEWEETYGFKLIGSKFNKTEWNIPHESYVIEDFDNTDAGENGRILPVKIYYDDGYNGRLWTQFEIMLLPRGPDYYPIKAYGSAYGDEEAHGTAIPFPSNAKAGDDVFVTVFSEAGY
jgi:hypothetical protein